MAAQGQLFNPDNPPLAFSKEEGDARLAEIKANLRNRPNWYRHWDEPTTRVMAQFHDRRSGKL